MAPKLAFVRFGASDLQNGDTLIYDATVGVFRNHAGGGGGGISFADLANPPGGTDLGSEAAPFGQVFSNGVAGGINIVVLTFTDPNGHHIPLSSSYNDDTAGGGFIHAISNGVAAAQPYQLFGAGLLFQVEVDTLGTGVAAFQVVTAKESGIGLGQGMIAFGVNNDFAPFGPVDPFQMIAVVEKNTAGASASVGGFGVNTYDLSTSIFHVLNPVTGAGSLDGPAQIVSLIEGRADQTADLIQAKLTGGSVLYKVSAAGAITAADFIASAMPTSDPHVIGKLWNSSGVVHVSAG